MDVYVKEVDHVIGLGVYASRDFAAGELVLTSQGPILDYQTRYTIQIGWNRHLDVYAPIKYLNHSCDPNLGVRTDEAGRPAFYARRPIAADEQLCFDYAMTEYMHYPRTDPALEFDLTCFCGAANCRGKLGYYSELSESLRQAYAGCISDYLLQIEPQTIDRSLA